MTTSALIPLGAEEPLLYHYTNGFGAMGIIKSKKLWATRAQYLNDGKELAHAFDMASNVVLPELRARNPTGVDNLLSYLKTTRHVANVFIASLSADGDQLGQWRAYGRPGDSYSLGFRLSDIELASSGPDWDLQPCVYDFDQQVQLVRQAAEAVLAQFDRGEFGHSSENFVGHCHRAILDVAPRIKHRGFREEREWRLISTVTAGLPICYRPGSQSIVPYTEFALVPFDTPLSIPRCIVGPGATDPDGAVDALLALEQSHGIVRPNVEPSVIPFRAW